MVFSSLIFLFLFLPIVLAGYAVCPSRRLQNLFLLLASFIFYAWGELRYVPLILVSIIGNYLLGLWIDQARETPFVKVVLALTVILNIGLIGVFKYANFIVDNLNVVFSLFGFSPFHLAPVPLPLGISFFTFQAMSYVIDVYRRDTEVQRNPFHVALYILFFPQLIAGPIVRYRDVAEQIMKRTVTRAGFVEGIQRFTIGLSKKVLIANVLAVAGDAIFALSPEQLTPSVAWFGLACYTVQLYFDFSGYSDMAIGLGLLFGFRFLENFNYPYISTSVTELWQRWHLSLSTWFRDYLYIPMGGNRISPRRTYFNLMTVFVLCGLWHGATWNFVIYGLYQGTFLIAERMRWGDWLDSLPRPLQHLYAMMVWMVGLVIFRTETLGESLLFLSVLANVGTSTTAEASLTTYATPDIILTIVVGIIFSAPVIPALRRLVETRLENATSPVAVGLHGVVLSGNAIILLFLLLASASWLAAGTYNPFIYFRF